MKLNKRAKGRAQYQKWEKDHTSVTLNEAVKAQCYVCNGEEEGTEDCDGKKSCPLYYVGPWGKKKAKPHKILTEEQHKVVMENLEKARAKKGGKR